MNVTDHHCSDNADANAKQIILIHRPVWFNKSIMKSKPISILDVFFCYVNAFNPDDQKSPKIRIISLLL